MSEKIDYYAFGDSFVKMFGHCQNVKYLKFKGKTLKGLTKPEREHRKKIQLQIEKSKVDQFIFMFGQVDLNKVRYYKVIRNQKYDEQTFENYAKWLASLNRKIIVLGIFISPIRREFLASSLFNKRTINEEQFQQNRARIFEEFQKTQQVRVRWNDLIKTHCQKFKIKFINLFPDSKLEQSFRDISPVTPHLRYEPCLNVLKPFLNLKIDKTKMTEQELQYEKYKNKRLKNCEFPSYEENNVKEFILKSKERVNENIMNQEMKNKTQTKKSLLSSFPKCKEEVFKSKKAYTESNKQTNKKKYVFKQKKEESQKDS